MKYVKIILIAFGVIFSLIIIVPILGSLIYSYTNTQKVNFAQNTDVDFVLNWTGLGAKRIKTVLNSTKSARSLTGDHLDAYEIQISHVSENELQDPHKFSRGDKLKGVYKDGLEFLTMWAKSDKLTWFPKYKELMTKEYYIYSWSIEYHGANPTSAKMIFINPSKKLVYYVSVKT